jgi:hypothetical protein
MRKLLVPFLIVFALPTAAYSSSNGGPPPTQDGTLSIREGRGLVQLSARGSITGRNIRFRLIGALFHAKIEARGIYLSAIGRGRGVIDGVGDMAAGVFYDGVWSLNDEPYHSLPDDATGFQLIAVPTPR